jgi:hypothetical protein
MTLPRYVQELTDFIEAEQHLILVERTEHGAERELEVLLELGEFARVERVCREMLARLPRKANAA